MAREREEASARASRAVRTAPPKGRMQAGEPDPDRVVLSREQLKISRWLKKLKFRRVLFGGGNNGTDKTEGAVYKNTICTYMHGPFLSKNPYICDDIIRRALTKKYGSAVLDPIDDYYEKAAKDAMIKRLLQERAAK